MADVDKAIQALQETKPPATDRFTYLTLVEEYLSPEILPTLNEILQDAELAQDIGWDLVAKLISLPGCDECLETIARLGNPREIILTVLEVLEELKGKAEEDEDEYEDGAEEVSEADVKKYITLLGMLAIVHRRIKTKRPSLFLRNTLAVVLSTYRPNQDMTAAVVNLVHSLSGRRRPTLPTRRSSVRVANPDQDGDASKDAPDPEAEPDEDPTEAEIQKMLLLSFVTSIINIYINGHDMQWSSRLLEYFNPKKLVPGKRSALQAFREDEELQARDAIVGQLVALTRDLGLLECSKSYIQGLFGRPSPRNPLAAIGDLSKPDDVDLSTGGAICVMAYWIFSASIFKADQPRPDIRIFPEHLSMLQAFLSENAQAQITTTPGTVDALLSIGVWLQHSNRVAEEGSADFMAYHHLLTLCAVFHPSLPARNAATSLAGFILHTDPDEDGRLKILDDLLENCMFAALKACAVTWLREEIITASATTTGGGGGLFAGPDALEQLQYAVFPDMQFLKDLGTDELLEYWVQNAPFVLQAANFAFFLFHGEAYRGVVPAGMGAAVEQRYVEPLVGAAAGLERSLGKEMATEGVGQVVMDLGVLVDRLRSLTLS